VIATPQRLDSEALLQFTDQDRAWAIVDPVHLNRLNFKDERYPGVEVIPLFRGQEDAQAALQSARSRGSRRIRLGARFQVLEVPLLPTAREVMGRKTHLAVVLYGVGTQPTRVAP
jgi:hypothetical protein